MAARMYYDQDADPEALRRRRIAIIGYGSQGHAHALNLRDGGHDVVVGLKDGSGSRARAEADGVPVRSAREAAEEADITMVLAPDTEHRRLYDAEIAPAMRRGKTLMFAHGFSIHYGQVTPPPEVDVLMVAPKGPGHVLRRIYTEGQGVPALFAVGQDASGDGERTALAYAAGIGSTRAGVLRTTFQEETETDLFGEQAVLCGGITALIKGGFETLVEAGYQPELAYFECMHEMKLIVDLLYQGGLNGMRYSVSDTAEYGDYMAGPRVVDEGTRARMRELLADVRDGSFARRWIAENEAGRPEFERLRAAEREHQIEEVGERLRGSMSWLGAPTGAAAGAAAPAPQTEDISREPVAVVPDASTATAASS